MSRLFVATFLEPENSDKIVSFQDKNLKALEEKLKKPVRATGRNSLHITWHFLGDVKEEEIAQLKKELSNSVLNLNLLQEADLKINYDIFEFWPNYKRPRVGVIRASNAPDAILTLARTIQKACKNFSCAEAKKHFKPHITLFRVRDKRNSKPRPAGTEPELASPWLSIIQKIDKVELLKSDLEKGPPLYTSLLSISLK